MEPKHFRAIELILEGKSNIAIAKELGVDRSTIARWRSSPTFNEVLKETEEEMKQRSKKHLLQLVEKARVICEEALDNGDIKVALAIIKRFDEQTSLKKYF